MQEVHTLTGGQMKIAPGTLYRSIKKMLKAGMIREVLNRPQEPDDDERRRYYELTDFGEKVASAEAERLSRLVKLAQNRRLLGEY